MHENNFEKQVREKMDQLGFDPTDSIWERVDKEINKEKKRRRPLFWLFFFSGLALAGGAYYFSGYKNSSTSDKLNYQLVGVDKKQEGETGNKSGINEPGKNKDASNEKLSKSNDTGNEYKKPNETLSKNNAPTIRKQNGMKSSERHKNIPGGKIINADDRTIAASGEKHAAESAAVVAGAAELNARDAKDSHLSNDSAALKKSEVITENKSPVKDSVSSPPATAKKTEKKKSNGWKIGYTGSVGFSNVNQDLFKSISASNNTVSYAAAAPGTPVSQPLSNNNYSSSAVSAGFSFGAGVFVSHDLFKRISLSGGLGYHYYSTKIKTGPYVSNTNLLSLSNGSPSVNSFYTNGNTRAYTNQYHFIELPVTLNIQLNKSKQRPVIWEAGLSLSYLFSTNALYYDPSHNVYFENDDLLNRTQLNGITAIMVGFPLGKSALQLGPQLQYGFTGLLKNSSGNPGHLIYYGLKISFIPGRK